MLEYIELECSLLWHTSPLRNAAFCASSTSMRFINCFVFAVSTLAVALLTISFARAPMSRVK